MKLWCCFLFFFIALNMFCAEAQETSELAASHTFQLCGRDLSSMINKLCTKQYKIIQKRDTSLMMDNLTNQRRFVAAERRRVRRDLNEECCEQACTVEEAIQYCSY